MSPTWRNSPTREVESKTMTIDELLDCQGPTEQKAKEALAGFHSEMHFGQYKGQPLIDIDRSYLHWMLSSCGCISDRQRNTVKMLIQSKTAKGIL
jgi:Putative quorum-sensing-regulated virulence factor